MWSVILIAAVAAVDPKSSDTEITSQRFGAPITQAQDVKISDLVAHPDEYLGKTVRVRGVVVDVGEKEGTWLTIANERGDGPTMRIAIEDEAAALTNERKGAQVMVEGTFEPIKHARDEAGLSIEAGDRGPSVTGESEKAGYQIRTRAARISL